MKAKKLFHTVVVIGASLTGVSCSGDDGATDAGTTDSMITVDSSTMDSGDDATAMLDSMMPSDGGDDADADGMVLIL